MTYAEMMTRARKFNAEMDEVERKCGNTSPKNCSLHVHLHTAMTAIESGLSRGATDSIAEGQAMLEELLARLRVASEVKKQTKADVIAGQAPVGGMEAEFQDMMRRAYPGDGVSKLQETEMRKAFFGGALVAFLAIQESIKTRGNDIVNERIREINDFHKKMNRESAQRG